jgi:hypothetical protein
MAWGSSSMAMVPMIVRLHSHGGLLQEDMKTLCRGSSRQLMAGAKDTRRWRFLVKA